MMKFSDFYVCDAGGAVLCVNTFRANGVFDPQYAVGGGSPSLLTQWGSFYRRYKVIASEISISCLNEDAARTIVGIIARRPDATVVATATAAQQLLLEGTSGVWAYLPASSSMFRPVKLSMYRTTREMIPVDTMDNSLSGFTQTTDPTVVWFWEVVNFNQDTSSAGSTIDIVLTIQYYVELFEYADPSTD